MFPKKINCNTIAIIYYRLIIKLRSFIFCPAILIAHKRSTRIKFYNFATGYAG